MGTRGLLGHIIKGKKKAVYNHFDSYPEGLGQDIENFIKGLSEEDVAKMIEMLEKIEWISDSRPQPCPQEVQERYIAAGFCDFQVADKRPDDWYCLLRNVQGAAALPRILDGTLGHLVDSTRFAEDELFCEWQYWIDWEARTVTVRGYRRGVGGRDEATVGFGELTGGWMRGLGILWEGEPEEDEEDDESDHEKA